jgi:hypothetical protein
MISIAFPTAASPFALAITSGPAAGLGEVPGEALRSVGKSDRPATTAAPRVPARCKKDLRVVDMETPHVVNGQFIVERT